MFLTACETARLMVVWQFATNRWFENCSEATLRRLLYGGSAENCDEIWLSFRRFCSSRHSHRSGRSHHSHH